MSILVTGGAGFIGSNFILDWFNDQDEGIINLDKLTYASHQDNLSSLQTHPHYRFIKGDIANPELLKALLTEHQPRAIINFAAESHVDRSIHAPNAFIETNIVGTFHLLESARQYWQTLDEKNQTTFRFIHISTDEVYGSLQPHEPPFTETHRYAPNSPYSASKASSDHLVRAYFQTYGLPCITMNCSNNYGPYQFPEKLIPLMIHHALTGKTLPIYGDGQQIRDWLYVKDHCAAIRQILDVGTLGAVYNVSGNNEKTNLEVVHTICTHLDNLCPKVDQTPYHQQIRYIKDRPGHDRRYAIDASKLKKQLNWSPSESFDSGIEKTIRWYLDHQNWISDVTQKGYQTWLKTQYQ